MFSTWCIATCAAAMSPAERPVQEFPLGVYWPWERTGLIAENADMDKWAFTKKTCELLKEQGADSIWLVNIGVDDLKSLLKITRPLGLKLVPCLSEIEAKNFPSTTGQDPAAKDFKAKAVEYYARRIPEIVLDIGEDRAGVLAWVLSDEPTGVFLDLMDPIREIFAKADPDRSTLAVSMWMQTPDLIAKTRLTTFCVDLYPFFGPNDPNGSHTPDASRHFYSSNVQRMVEDAGKDGRVGWVMPQCFIEIWGPTEMTPDGIVTALPGAYIHWRTPTLAEMRWQTWEGIRLGAKGVFYFVLLSVGKDDPKVKPPEDAYLGPILVKEATQVGYDALLDRRGNPTPQGSEMFMLFRKLARHKALLGRLIPSNTQWVAAEGGARIGCFVDDSTGERYAVAVNPDFGATQAVTLTATMGTRGLMDVLTGKSLELMPLGRADGSRGTTIRLEAGDGVLLKLEN